MPLHKFVIPSETIHYKGEAVIDIRGLSFVDISLLINRHRDDVEKLFAIYKEFTSKEGASLVGDALIMRYGFELATQAPGILAHVVALAADEPDRIAEIATLPATVLIDALVATCRLTIEDFGGVKKMVATLWETVLSFAPEEVRAEAGKNGQN